MSAQVVGQSDRLPRGSISNGKRQRFGRTVATVAFLSADRQDRLGKTRRRRGGIHHGSEVWIDAPIVGEDVEIVGFYERNCPKDIVKALKFQQKGAISLVSSRDFGGTGEAAWLESESVVSIVDILSQQPVPGMQGDSLGRPKDFLLQQVPARLSNLSPRRIPSTGSFDLPLPTATDDLSAR